jgi:SAM-dependent methyltransferase
MDNAFSALKQKALRIIGEEGYRSLFKKSIRRIRLYTQSESLIRQKHAFSLGGEMHYPNAMAERWLQDNRSNFGNPFYILLRNLLDMNVRLNSVAPVSCSDYRSYFRERFMTNGFPFEIVMDATDDKENITEFITAHDYAYLAKMIQHVFIALIKYLSDSRGQINLLDFGTGPTCGMFGEGGRFLFENGKVNIDGITFFGIDDLHKPQGAIFKKSTYRQCNILSFTPDEQFDLVTGHHVLEHCYNWEDVVTHLSRLLKRGGYLYLSFPHFGGFYDSAYRLMSALDHCANFDVDMLANFSRTVGLELCLSDTYVDPNGRFGWIGNIYPNLVNSEMADCFYDLCVKIDSKLLLGYHHYGHYVVFRKI